jgi:hypothetical protein
MYCTHKLYTGGTLITQIIYNTIGIQYYPQGRKVKTGKGRQDEKARNVRMKGMAERGDFEG